MTPGRQTCSAGLVEHRDDEPADTLMARVDNELNAAKHAGCNQLALSTASHQERAATPLGLRCGGDPKRGSPVV